MNATIEKNVEPGFYKTIIPIILSVFSVYLTIGMMLGILPGYIETGLKYNSIIVGVVIGTQALATLLTRSYAGKLTDTKGARLSSRIGGTLGIITGILYLTAALFSRNAATALTIILTTRILHGIAESLLVTGSLTWGIGLVGVEKSGKVMTWNGIAMYAGIALGAPLGIALFKTTGIESAFGAISLLSGLSLIITHKLPSLPVDLSHVRAPFYKVVGKVSGQGLGLAFASIGFACISSFIVLLFTQKHWGNASQAFMMFGGCYILVRIFFSSFPDKYGAYAVALISLIIEIAGQLLIGFAGSGSIAILGCCLTGAGFSLIFPSLGVMAIKKVSPQMRGTALGAYGAFFDLSLGIAAPVAGLIALWYNYQMVYVFGALSCLTAVLVLFLGEKEKADTKKTATVYNSETINNNK
ncbi:MFS transporter [Pedobacter hartonius]|uniref:Predicted arabinose efflux permease, MFS family n=1 Tax=Pedobacter hartonius TaxID=425514 RepID=A0A1H4FU36_9SPHI|nr:MFS transporter [Pedobacter hartonius]SEB00815.1 Predicted arabinose efflux permease, MFS family [Pedobacter hartonius]